MSVRDPFDPWAPRRPQRRAEPLTSRAGPRREPPRPVEPPRPREDEAERLRRQLEGLSARYVELQQDHGRLRERQARAEEAARREERRRMLGDLIEVADAVERALASSEATDTAWHAGTEAIGRQLLAVLERNGVQRFGVPGEAFDPRLHEAIARSPSGVLPPGRIAAVEGAGYRFDDGTLLRPARVVVTSERS